MKGFIFKYQNILKIREDKETEVKNELGIANKKRNDIQQSLDDVNRKFINYQKKLEQEMMEGVSALRLRDIGNEKIYFRESIADLEHKLKVADMEINDIKLKLIEASKDKKIMEKLKERELEDYRQKEKEEEDKLNDQIVTFNSTIKR